jgi:hypothetical protein
VRTSEVLNRAADLIEQHGWTQREGWWGQPGVEGVCLEGGIMAAMGLDYNDWREASWEDPEDEGYDPIRDGLLPCPAYTAVREYLGVEPRRLYWWNDEPGRTREEVVEVLRTVAQLEADKENNENEEQV